MKPKEDVYFIFFSFLVEPLMRERTFHNDRYRKFPTGLTTRQELQKRGKIFLEPEVFENRRIQQVL
jgi:hypothetical protein